MYRIILKDSEMADLIRSDGNIEPSSVTLIPNFAEGKLGFLLGRAQYLEGMLIGEFNRVDTSVPEVTQPTIVETVTAG